MNPFKERQLLLSFLTRKIFSNYHLLVRPIVSSMLVKELFTKLCVISGIISRIVWGILYITTI
uniref:Uncharacterized protein n=1 Tax=Oryza nivara TaxID=4536 RepID=A0A0E0IA25_ORYNI